MRCLVTALVVVCLLLPLLHRGPQVVGVAQASAGLRATSNTDRIRQMQHSDYKKRLDQQKKARSEERQMASIATTERSSSDFDYAVLIVLVASVVTLAFLANRRRRSHLRW